MKANDMWRVYVRLASSVVIGLLSIFGIVGPSLFAAQARSETGRLLGTVRLTAAASTPSAATAYGRRSVAPRACRLNPSRRLVSGQWTWTWRETAIERDAQVNRLDQPNRWSRARRVLPARRDGRGT